MKATIYSDQHAQLFDTRTKAHFMPRLVQTPEGLLNIGVLETDDEELIEHYTGRRNFTVILEDAELEVPGPNATDKAFELADEHGIDVLEIEGSGVGGRITVFDVEAAIAEEE